MKSSFQRARIAALPQWSKFLGFCFMLAVTGSLLMASPAMAAPAATASTTKGAPATKWTPATKAMATDGINGNLVSVEWLEKHLGHADVVVLDTSFGQSYAAKHIPGALTADFLTYGFPERSAAEMEQRYQSWGLSPAKKVVLYDQGGSYLATRLFYSLYYHGFPAKNLFVLDGGLAKWQAQGLPVTKDIPPAPATGIFRIGKTREDVKVSLPDFITASGDPVNNVLLEANESETHFGGNLMFDRAGHIPNARSMPSTDFFNADKTFKSPEEIRKMLSHLGIRPDQQIHSHCGGGIAASVPFFALKFMLDYPKVKLSTESQMGWLADERELPFWTYDAPLLMRGTNWLQAWTGKMMRMYRGSQVSIVDVRTAEAFKEGHVPFALNIPGDVFRNSIADPGKLAEILGPAGVDASHEAVVVSGAGLTKESALAFVMLEKLGQKKVSVFMDSVETWRQRGFTVATDATAVGPKKAPQDLSIPPTRYPVALRKDVTIADPQTTQGLYPKIFIASGKDLPAKAQDGKIVHIPYTNLLNADGTPKAAKDIWAILSKAGVSRYAEIICVSDDPGEAAANYFILKLMGYPDIKVLV